MAEGFGKSRLARLTLTFFKLVFVAYLAFAVVYTFAVAPFATVAPSPSPFSYPRLLQHVNKVFSKSQVVEHETVTAKPHDSAPKWSQASIHWAPVWAPSKQFQKQTQLSTSESLFLNKAFSQSMQPSQIIPFYYRAQQDLERSPLREDITIVTLVTSNRFKVLALLAQKYQGPISAAVHITGTPVDRRDQLLNELHHLYFSTPGMSQWVDIHLVLDTFDRQFNLWRNAARLFARTEFVMMLDVDFAICSNFRRAILDSSTILDKLRNGSAALVLPAFEFVKHEDGLDQSKFPASKDALSKLYTAQNIEVFHRSWEAGHNSTEYKRYFDAASGDVYKVEAYQHAYEPYVIFLRERAPWCDERFIGYGGNKAACLYEMHLDGMSFYVLSDHFLIHQSHPYDEDIRKAERKYNRQLYLNFREEACLRTLYRSLIMKRLDTPLGLNVQAECQKIPGVSSLAVDMIQSFGLV